MNIIKTKSFELAIYAKGNQESDKLAIVLPGRLDTKDYVNNTSIVDLLQDTIAVESKRKKGEIPRGLPRNMLRFIGAGSRACPGV